MSIPAPYRSNMSAILADPEPYLHLMSEHISSGGTLGEWAVAWGVSYKDVCAWIDTDADRREMYRTALTLRGEYLSDIVIRQLRSMCDADISLAFDENGNMRKVKDMPIDVRRSIIAIEVDEVRHGMNGDDLETQTKRIKLVDPAKAVELLGKYRKMFTEKVELSGKVNFDSIKFFDDSEVEK